MLKREEGGKFSLVKFNCSNRECPQENKEAEEEFKSFVEKGISNLVRDGAMLIMEAGGQQKRLTEDGMRKEHDDAQKAKLAAVSGGS